MGEDEDERGAVLAAAQGKSNPVPGVYHILVSDGGGNPVFEKSGKMGGTKVTVRFPYPGNSRITAAVTARQFHSYIVATHVSSPVGDPYDPDLIITGHDRIFRHKPPVDRHNHLNGVDAEFHKHLLDCTGSGVNRAPAVVRKDNVHQDR